MSKLVKLTTQQVGKCGELLVQYKLLKAGIDSAPMTTDYGIDLVAIDSHTHKTVTIQVKASTHHVGDGSSKWVEWNMPERCIADYVAVVDIERNKAWLLKTTTFEDKASKTTDEGSRLWWYVPDHKPEGTTIKRLEEDFESFNMDAVIPTLFN